MQARRAKSGSGKGRKASGPKPVRSSAGPKAKARLKAGSKAGAKASSKAKTKAPSRPLPKKAAPRKTAPRKAGTSKTSPKPAAPRKAAPAPRARREAPRHSYAGACHCGALEFTYETALEPRRWRVLSCQCSFCRGHGARTTADPDGLVLFDFKLPEFLRRYRFGLRTGDYLVCRECGTYIAAVLLTGRGALATVNVNSLREPPRSLPPGRPVSPELESMEARRAARARSWTPVMGPV
jgi:hypothetical protein